MNNPSAAFAGFAEALARAHALDRPTVAVPSPAPSTIGEAMEVQAEVMQRLGVRHSGWKLGFDPGGAIVGAPLYSGYIHASGESFPAQAAGLWGVEPEIAVRLGADLPPRPGAPYSREDIMNAVASVLVGIEIVASRIIDFKAAPYPAFVADNIGNAGYFTGTEISDWRHLDLTNLRAILTIGGETVHDAHGNHPNGDPLKPIVDYANSPSDRIGGLKAGQLITTGSLCGLVPATGPCEVTATIEGIGESRVTIV